MQQQILHLLCTAGSCRLHFSGHEHELTSGCCMIAMASHVGNILPSQDCQLYQLLFPAEQQASCMPHSSYGVCGWLHLFMHPIFVLQGMRALYLDVMNAHASLFEHEEATLRSADIMSRFIRMLESGTYRQYRTVAYYAQELCVTPKHLHKISTQVSGRTPSYWIQQFTMMEIKHLLMHGKFTAKEVAAKLNFENMSHFSRYIGQFGKNR